MSRENSKTEGTNPHTPRKLTPAQNLILTIKVLVVFGLIGAALWGIDQWNAVR